MAADGRLRQWKADVWYWRFLGVALYDTIIVLIAATSYAAFSVTPWHASFRKLASAVIHPWTWVFLLSFCAAQVLVIAAQSPLLTATEPQLLRLWRFRLPQWLAVPLSRIAAPCRSLKGLGSTAVFLALSAAAGGLSVHCLMALRGEHRGSLWVWTYGTVLGLLHGCILLASGGTVLSFPIVQQQRWFRVKKELVTAAFPAVVLPGLAFLVTALVHGPQPCPGSLVCSLRILLLADLAGAITAFCLFMGSVILNIVTTEHVQFALPGDQDPNSLLFAALQAAEEPVLQSLALQDLCMLAQDPSVSWRRAAIFADETGGAWRVPVQACLKEVEELTRQAAAALPQAPNQAPKTRSATGSAASSSGRDTTAAPKWNVHPKASTKALGGMGKVQEEAAWHMRARCWRGVTCARALAGLCAASRSEDSLGTAQLTEPSLGTAIGVLASSVLALQAFAKTSVAHTSKASALAQRHKGLGYAGGWASPKAAVPAYALHDAALTGLCSVTTAFGDSLLILAKTLPGQLPYGSSSDVLALLSRCMSYSE